MGSKSAPAPPDYRGAAEAQGASSREVTRDQTFANRPTQNTPWGSSSWTPSVTTDPATGQPVTTWEQNLTLDPTEQAALDSQRDVMLGRSDLAAGLIGRTGNELANPMDWGSLPGYGQAPAPYSSAGAPSIKNTDFSSLPTLSNVDYSSLPGLDASGGYNPDFAQTFYDRSASLLEPRMERQRAGLETRLRNQGLVPGTEAYDNAMNDLLTNQGETMGRLAQDSVFGGADLQDRQFSREYQTRDMYGNEAQDRFNNDAYMRSLLAGEMQQQFGNEAALRDLYNTEQATGFSQGMQGANFQNALRQQAMAEQQQRRTQSINEMNALLTGQQVQQPNTPSFMGANAADPTQYLTAAGMYGDFMNQRYNIALGPLNSLLSNQAIGFS